MKRAAQANPGHAISPRRLVVLAYFARDNAVPYDKASSDQEWLLKQSYLRAEIEQRPPGSDWPRVVLKITDRGRAALQVSHDRA